MTPPQFTPEPQDPRAKDETPCWLTSDCERVQGELLHLAEALSEAALSEFKELRASILKAVGEFRRHFRDHVHGAEGSGGVCECVKSNWPQLGPQVNKLCHEHAEIQHRVEGLEQRLEFFDDGDPAWEEAIRQQARRLAEVLARHQATAQAILRRTLNGY